ncbi:oxidoreductase [Sciscionella marina]|uniref:oxidoreductase n=1 Tax=Sciscionella marina TaxID=508770 RepID=UPI000368E60B|nr:oxidoreductase [Sciscionella marina]
MSWSEREVGDQSGRTFVVTGANSGLGLRVAQVLGEHGARVLLACRSESRGAQAVRRVPGGELVRLDVAELSSVHSAAGEIRDRVGDRLDGLVNNAGITWPPLRRTTEGFESTFATNHLGHAALTWLLMPALRGAEAARVVHVSSISASGGGLDLEDPNYQRRPYRAYTAYMQSKQANLLFALELDRRLRAAGESVRSVAAHPGMTRTELFPNATRSGGPRATALLRALNPLIAQSVEGGALPLLRAATAGDGGEYYGPSGPLEIRGGTGRARIPRSAAHPETARRLWNLTAELTGVEPDPAG